MNEILLQNANEIIKALGALGIGVLTRFLEKRMLIKKHKLELEQEKLKNV